MKKLVFISMLSISISAMADSWVTPTEMETKNKEMRIQREKDSQEISTLKNKWKADIPRWEAQQERIDAERKPEKIDYNKLEQENMARKAREGNESNQRHQAKIREITTQAEKESQIARQEHETHLQNNAIAAENARFEQASEQARKDREQARKDEKQALKYQRITELLRESQKTMNCRQTGGGDMKCTTY